MIRITGEVRYDLHRRYDDDDDAREGDNSGNKQLL